MTSRNTELDVLHPHSFIAEALRVGVLEYDLYFRLNSNYMNAWASLNAHPGINIKSAISGFTKLCKDIRNTLPFTKYDKVAEELDNELQKAIDAFKRMEKEDGNK